MAADGTINLKADISELRKALQSIEGITAKEARAMAKELEKGFIKAEKAAKKAATGSKQGWSKMSKEIDKSTRSLKDNVDAAGDADSVMMGLGGALDLVNPALGDMARTAGDALAGVEALGKGAMFSNPIFIALAVTAAAVGAAYVYLKEQEETAAEAAKEHKRVRDALHDSFLQGEERLKQLRFQVQEQEGAFSEMDAAMERAENQARSAFAPTLSKLNDELEKQTKIWDDLGVEYGKSREATGAAQDAFEKQKKVVIEVNNAIAHQGKLQREMETLLKRQAKNTIDYSDAVHETTVAAEEASEAEAAMSEARRAAEKAAQDATKATKDQEKALNALNKAAEKASKKAAKEHEDAWAQAQAAVEANNEKTRQREAEADAKAAAQKVATINTSLDLIGSLQSTASELSTRLAEEGSEEAKKAAIIAFNVAKAAGIGEIAIHTAVAAMRAYADLPPPANVIASASYVALGAVNAGLVAAQPPPSFHSGGMIGGAPDERLVTARAGEGVLTPQGVNAIGGPAGLAAANRGSAAPMQITVVQQYKHRAFGAFVQEDLKLSNSPLRQAIVGNVRVGHRRD
jgi:hypothetical protein